MISVTILTKNSERTLRSTLESLRSFPEVVLFDTGSTDATLQIAKEFLNVKIFEGPFEGFGPAHNLASSYASSDWILSIDSDEVLSKELIEEIQQLKPDEQAVYSINRKNFLNGKWITGCGGWHPDPVIRLYNRQKTRFTDAKVHERIIADGLNVISLCSPLFHTPYQEMCDFLNKMQHYSTLFAEQNKHRKSSSLTKALFHCWAAFLKSYFLKKGFLDGKEGLIISLYNGHTAFYKYLKLMESNEKDSMTSP